jgi:hypothetical protein
VIIETLASYRLTRLLQKDSFPPAEALRRRVMDRGGSLADMWECPWCLGMWVSLGVVVLRRRRLGADELLAALAIGAAVGATREVEEVLEDLWDEHKNDEEHDA